MPGCTRPVYLLADLGLVLLPVIKPHQILQVPRNRRLRYTPATGDVLTIRA
jgi:hypothetical protein